MIVTVHVIGVCVNLNNHVVQFQQLVRDQQLRAKHQRSLLKQREDAIFDKSKAELQLLENQKRYTD